VEDVLATAIARGEVADARTLGHDLRTPLAVIHGYAQLLRSEELSPEQRARACELILEKCEELNAVIRRLLEPSESALKTPVAVEQTA
jgi:signal transduction histidine kinase